MLGKHSYFSLWSLGETKNESVNFLNVIAFSNSNNSPKVSSRITVDQKFRLVGISNLSLLSTVFLIVRKNFPKI